jgi:hypothetical protein
VIVGKLAADRLAEVQPPALERQEAEGRAAVFEHGNFDVIAHRGDRPSEFRVEVRAVVDRRCSDDVPPQLPVVRRQIGDACESDSVHGVFG